MTDDDPVERMLKMTGCIDFHHQVQQCFFEHQDWRKCQAEVKEFKECMDVYRKKAEQEMVEELKEVEERKKNKMR